MTLSEIHQKAIYINNRIEYYNGIEDLDEIKKFFKDVAVVDIKDAIEEEVEESGHINSLYKENVHDARDTALENLRKYLETLKKEQALVEEKAEKSNKIDMSGKSFLNTPLEDSIAEIEECISELENL